MKLFFTFTDKCDHNKEESSFLKQKNKSNQTQFKMISETKTSMNFFFTIKYHSEPSNMTIPDRRLNSLFD